MPVINISKIMTKKSLLTRIHYLRVFEGGSSIDEFIMSNCFKVQTTSLFEKAHDVDRSILSQTYVILSCITVINMYNLRVTLFQTEYQSVTNMLQSMGGSIT